MKYFFIAIVWSFFIAIVSFMHTSRTPKLDFRFFEADKLAHAGVYFILTAALMWGFWRLGRLKIKTMLLSFGVSCVYGFLIECAQYALFPYRYFEILDIIANIIGSLSGLIVAFFLIK